MANNFVQQLSDLTNYQQAFKLLVSLALVQDAQVALQDATLQYQLYVHQHLSYQIHLQMLQKLFHTFTDAVKHGIDTGFCRIRPVYAQLEFYNESSVVEHKGEVAGEAFPAKIMQGFEKEKECCEILTIQQNDGKRKEKLKKLLALGSPAFSEQGLEKLRELV